METCLLIRGNTNTVCYNVSVNFQYKTGSLPVGDPEKEIICLVNTDTN